MTNKIKTLSLLYPNLTRIRRTIMSQSGFYGQYVDIDGVFKSEFELIKRYRENALHPEVDSAIEDIINEAIVSDQNDSPVEIDLENLPRSKAT